MDKYLSFEIFVDIVQLLKNYCPWFFTGIWKRMITIVSSLPSKLNLIQQNFALQKFLAM